MTIRVDDNTDNIESRSWDTQDSGIDSLPIDAQGIILRGMCKADITEDFSNSGRLSFRGWDRELQQMQQDEGITYLSATYQPEISGQSECIVTTYTPSGLLFDLKRVKITDIFKQDVNTAWGCEDSISKDADIRCQTLEELQEYILSDPLCQNRQAMNELKINAKISSVCGLYFQVSKSMSDIFDYRKLTMAVWKKHILEKFKIDLPVYSYETSGKLTFEDMKKETLKKQLPKIFFKQQALKNSYAILYNDFFSEK